MAPLSCIGSNFDMTARIAQPQHGRLSSRQLRGAGIDRHGSATAAELRERLRQPCRMPPVP